MKKSVPFLFALLFVFSAYAQRGHRGGQKAPSITGKVFGTLLDSLTNAPVEFASVVLINAKNGKEVDGLITDEKGNFKFPEVKLGAYKIHFSFVGYDEKTVKKVILKPAKPDVEVGKVLLVPATKLLETITVTGEAALIENKIDRVVFNNEKDVDGNLGDATDVLRKVPLLSVDLDGNVSLRGSSNIRILINGKPSGMFSNNVADALKMFPADQIKSVEVITVPSAKYDGEGSAGIINLITRKKQVNGIAGSVNTTIGTRHNSTSLNLNVAKGRFGLTGGGHAVWSPPRDAVFEFDREDVLEGGELRTLMQDGTNSSERLGFRGKFGAYYDFNAFNSINSNVSFHGANFNKIGDFSSALIDPFNEDQISQRKNDTKTQRNSIDWNTDYTRKFPDSEREFSLGFQLNRSIDNKDIKLLQTGNLESLNIDELSDNESNNLETTLQVDYVHPFSKSTKLEVGAKGILRSIDSDFFFEEFDFDQNKYVRDAGRSDQFAYQQDVYAGYASLNTKFGEKYSMIAGVRYEGTAIDGQFAVEDNKGFKNDYSNILPTVILSRKMSQMSNLRISYTQRIQRPSLRFINPYVDQQDRNNISFGNPELQPELSHNFELGYNNYIKGVVINTALYYRHTTEVIQSLLSIDGAGRSATTFQNVGEDNTLGLNFFTSTTIKKILSLRANFDFRHKDLSGELRGSKISNSGIEYNGNAGATLKLPKEISLQFWGMFRSARVTLQGTRTTFRMYSLSMAKKIWGKRGSIGIKATNLFHDKLHFDTILEGENFKQSSLYAYPFRSIGINFNYRFGKLDFKGGERKNKVKNTDQKEGEGGEF